MSGWVSDEALASEDGNALEPEEFDSRPSARIRRHANDEDEAYGSDEDDEGLADEPLGEEDAGFFPPLAMQRRVFILTHLRKEGVRSVCEMGCGDGGLLEALCQPANFTDEFPPWVEPESDDEPHEAPTPPEIITPSGASSPNPTDSSTPPSPAALSRIRSFMRRVKRVPSSDRELHVSKVLGCDISDTALAGALVSVKPPPIPDEIDSFTNYRERWEPLTASIFKGSLAVYNDSLDNTDAFVLTEVIEHLDEATFARFGPIVLGLYRPRVVVVTTPNYDFAPHFRARSAESRRDHEWPDPTGRTDRIFRDSDHRFEFTSEEFSSWADDVASEYDYEVSYSGVGTLTGYLGRPRAEGEEPIYATQAALFRRKHANEPERSPRSPKTQELPFYQRTDATIHRTALAKLDGTPSTQVDSHFSAPHKLLGSFTYNVEASANQNPAPASEIREIIRNLMQNSMAIGKCSLMDVWGREPLRTACRGRIGVAVEAILLDEDEWQLDIDPDRFGAASISLVLRSFEEADEVLEPYPYGQEVGSDRSDDEYEDDYVYGDDEDYESDDGVGFRFVEPQPQLAQAQLNAWSDVLTAASNLNLGHASQPAREGWD